MRALYCFVMAAALSSGCRGADRNSDPDAGLDASADSDSPNDGDNPTDGDSPTDGDTEDSQTDSDTWDSGDGDGATDGDVEALSGYCDQIRIAVFDDGNESSRARVAGRVSVHERDIIVTAVDVVPGGMDMDPIQTLPGHGETIAAEEHISFLAEGTAADELTALCGDEDNRVEPFGFVARGTAEGQPFEARCGRASSGSSWPPGVIVTCHSGLAEAPIEGSASVEVFGEFLTSDLYITMPHPEGEPITAVDTQVEIWGSAWYAGLTEARITEGWDPHVTESSSGEPTTVVQLFADEDLFGLELCPAMSDDPEEDPPPMIFARIRGTTSAGPFESEMFAYGCYRYEHQ